MTIIAKALHDAELNTHDLQKMDAGLHLLFQSFDIFEGIIPSSDKQKEINQLFESIKTLREASFLS